MKSLKAVTVVILVGVTAFGLPAMSEEIKIATFNAEFLTRPKIHVKFGFKFNIKDENTSVISRWQQPGYRDQEFAKATEQVATVIAKINADVIALTEVGDDKDVSELQEAVSKLDVEYQYTAICECTDNVTHQHVAVLSKYPFQTEPENSEHDVILKKIPGRERYLKEADDPESEKSTGISKGFKVQFIAHGHLFHLYILHLRSEKNGHENDMQRVAQASIARRHMLPLLSAGANVIVAGDLNDKRGQPALRRIRGLDDIQPDLVQTGLKEFFPNDKLDTRWTFEFEGERGQIDHVLLSEGVLGISSKPKSEVVDPENQIVSDHRAFIVNLSVKPR